MQSFERNLSGSWGLHWIKIETYAIGREDEVEGNEVFYWKKGKNTEVGRSITMYIV